MGAPLTASTASRGKKKEGLEEEFDDTPIHIALISWLSYLFLVFFGHLRDFMVRVGLEKSRSLSESPKLADFPPLFRDFESFYTRSMYRRICDAWNRPICSVPGARVTLKERASNDWNWTFYFTGETKEYHNLGSYNYLGFAENKGECCDAACRAVDLYGTSPCSARYDFGTYSIHNELEQLVARFVGREDAITFGMGFATNAGNIPTLVDKNCLIISDELNHASLVLGCRLSGAKIKVFKHNDMEDLESILRASIIEGQPRTHRPCKKILICIEGIYSMEGSMCNLPEIINLKKKYKAYLYLDEAHSIGAIGKTGRGVCEHFGVNVNDIDILMGTFTKSFGSAGGYIAGDKKLIDHIRAHSHAHLYSTAIAPGVVQQVITSMKIIMGEQGGNQGAERLRQLAENSLYFRRQMKEMGFIIYGNDASPVVPMLIFVPCKICAFSREMKKRGVCVVVVGYPATPVLGARSRFCLSAAHTRKDIDEMLAIISEVGDILGLKYLRGKHKAIAAKLLCRR